MTSVSYNPKILTLNNSKLNKMCYKIETVADYFSDVFNARLYSGLEQSPMFNHSMSALISVRKLTLGKGSDYSSSLGIVSAVIEHGYWMIKYISESGIYHGYDFEDNDVKQLYSDLVKVYGFKENVIKKKNNIVVVPFKKRAL